MRECKDWIQTYMDWTVPRGECKEHLIKWGGLLCLSAALRRKVSIPKTLMGSWTIYPYMYIIIVGPPGQARKTTSASYASDIMHGIPGIKVAADELSKEVMMNGMAESIDGSICILCGELSDLVSVSGDKIYEFLTSIFDGKASHAYATLSRGKQVANKPCINMLAATVPNFIATMPPAVIEGGLASRIIFVYEDDVRQRKLFYDDGPSKIFMATKEPELRKKLRKDLGHIANKIKGEFTIESRETRDKIEQWYIDTADKFPIDDPRVVGYYQRKPAHVLKVTMLLQIAKSDELIITMDNFNQAKVIVEETEGKLLKVFKHVGANPNSTIIEQIKDHILLRGRVPKKDILSKFYRHADPNKLEEFLDGLVRMDIITYTGDAVDMPSYAARQSKKIIKAPI